MSLVRKRLLQSLSANGFGQLINLLIQIVSVPLFINYWSVSIYGEWMIISTIPAYLAMTDMGFSSVAGSQMSMEVAAGEKLAALRTYQSTWVLLCVACLFVLSFGGGAVLLPIGDWLNLKSVTNQEVQIIVLLLSFAVIVNLQMGLLAAGFRCDGNYALGTWVANSTRLMEYGLCFLALYMGATPAAIAGVILITRCVGYLFTRWILRIKSPWISEGLSHADVVTVKSLTRPAFAFMAFPLGNALKNQGMLTIVGIALGPVSAVAFGTMRTLINSTHQAMGLIHNAVWPELSAAFGAGNRTLACKLHRIACKASFWLSLGTLLVLFNFGAWILEVWTLGAVAFDKPFFTLMLLTMLISSFWFTSSVVQVANNAHSKMAVLYLLATASATGIAYVLTPALGINGPALGLLVLEIAMALYVLPTSLGRVHDKVGPFFKYVFNPARGWT